MQVADKILFQESQCLDTLSEQDNTVIGVGRIPLHVALRPENLHESLVLNEVSRADTLQGFRDLSQGLAVTLRIRAGFRLDLTQALANRRKAGGRRREEGLFQDSLE